MKDFLGQQIEIGDVGLCIDEGRSSSEFKIVEVVGFTPHFLKLEHKRLDSSYPLSMKSPQKFVKCHPEDIVVALLRRRK